MPMEQNLILRRFVRMALFGGGAFAAGAMTHSSMAQAQVATANTAAPSPALEEVVVTGSRISAPNLESISPVTSVTSEEIKTTGVVRIEDLLNSLPQVVADQGSGISMGSNGTATLNLRGLGANRTLVLVNGRRLQGGDPGANLGATPAFASAADINQIPVALIDRVEVLTGGASSTYGADAVAGVVNFIMNDHFEGVRLDSNFGVYNHSNHESFINPLLTSKHFPPVTGTNWDGNNKDFTVVLGQAFADGAGHMEGYLGYRRTAPVTADHRDHAACVLTSAGSSTSAGPYVCSGSSNSAPAVFYNASTGKSYQVDPTGQVVSKYQRYNYAATHYLERNDERYTAGFMGKLKLNDHAEAYAEFSFMDDITTGAYAPAGAFLGSGKNTDSETTLPDGNLSVNCGPTGSAYGNTGMNPFLTASEFDVICAGGPKGGPISGGPVLSYLNSTRPKGATAYEIQNGDAQLLLARRNIEGGPRQDNYTHTAYRGVLGLRGEITEGWTYDAYGLFSTTRSLDFHNNDTSTNLIQNALFAVKNPVTGAITCRGNQQGCVPWNIWNPSISPSAGAAVKYFSTPGEYSANSAEDVVSAYVNGDLTSRGIKTPWAADGLKVVLGSEYRRDTLTTQPDQELLTADLAGFGSPIVAVNALAHVWEGFTEARMPIVRDAPGAKSLDMEAGYRYSSYSEGFNTNTYKIGVEWAPVSDVRLRSSYNVAKRVPNLQELFQPQHVGLDGGTDICASGTKLTALQCSYLQVTAAEYAAGVPPSPASQYNGLIGGNTKLGPETAKTTNVGVVFTPTFLPGFSATLDYTDIKITDLIQSFGATTIQANCLATADAASVWCQKIHRSPLGDIWTSTQGYIVDTLLNEGRLENKGIDLGMAYRLDMGSWGKFRSRLDAGYLLKLLYSPASVGGIPGKPYDCAGQFGQTCSAQTPPAPKYRHRLALDWDTPLTGFSVGATWRYFGIVHNSITNPSSPDYKPSFGIPGDNTIPTISYLDMRVSYNINKVTVRVGANNVLDKDPPIIDTLNDTGNSIYGESNTFPSLYDSLGRYIYANVTIDF